MYCILHLNIYLWNSLAEYYVYPSVPYGMILSTRDTQYLIFITETASHYIRYTASRLIMDRIFSPYLKSFIILQKSQFCRGINGLRVIVTTHLRLAPKLEISGIVRVFILSPSYRRHENPFDFEYMYNGFKFWCYRASIFRFKVITVIMWPHLSHFQTKDGSSVSLQ
jgi:hypothetical protein